jgi:hypothetical protein
MLKLKKKQLNIILVNNMSKKKKNIVVYKRKWITIQEYSLLLIIDQTCNNLKVKQHMLLFSGVI